MSWADRPGCTTPAQAAVRAGSRVWGSGGGAPHLLGGGTASVAEMPDTAEIERSAPKLRAELSRRTGCALA